MDTYEHMVNEVGELDINEHICYNHTDHYDREYASVRIIEEQILRVEVIGDYYSIN